MDQQDKSGPKWPAAPWEAYVDNDGFWNVRAISARSKCDVVGQEGIAYWSDDATQESIARLIAAAPELYQQGDALVQLLDNAMWANDYGGLQVNEADVAALLAALAQLSAALAKATGSQQ